MMEEMLAVQTTPLTVEAPVEALPEIHPEDAWDLTTLAGGWAAAARGLEKQDILIALTARNCPGSEALARQMEGYWDSLADNTYIVNAIGGDLEVANFTTISLGDVTFAAPGVPFLVLLGTGDARSLPFRALGLGPFSSDETRQAIIDFLNGRSKWVPEADEVEVLVSRGNMRLGLGRRNAFHAALNVNLPVEDEL